MENNYNKIVYRVEHLKTGEGPYVNSYIYPTEWLRLLSHNEIDEYNYSHFDSISEGGYSSNDDDIFGFKDIKSLQKWFNDYELEILKKNDFGIVCYKINEKYISWVGPITGQLTFKKEKAKRDTTTTIWEYSNA